MGRISTKEDKTKYQSAREKCGLSREKASELMSGISPERIERIESKKIKILTPDDVVEMSKIYKDPTLCNYYCTSQCAIGKQYVPEIKIKELSQIILEMIDSLNSVGKRQDRLIEIALDGKIDDGELNDFISIQNELKRINITVETLQFWAEKMMADGKINADNYNKLKNR